MEEDGDNYTPCEKCGKPASHGSVCGTCAHAGLVTSKIEPMSDRECTAALESEAARLREDRAALTAELIQAKRDRKSLEQEAARLRAALAASEAEMAGLRAAVNHAEGVAADPWGAVLEQVGNRERQRNDQVEKVG